MHHLLNPLICIAKLHKSIQKSAGVLRLHELARKKKLALGIIENVSWFARLLLKRIYLNWNEICQQHIKWWSEIRTETPLRVSVQRDHRASLQYSIISLQNSFLFRTVFKKTQITAKYIVLPASSALLPGCCEINKTVMRQEINLLDLITNVVDIIGQIKFCSSKHFQKVNFLHEYFLIWNSNITVNLPSNRPQKPGPRKLEKAFL